MSRRFLRKYLAIKQLENSNKEELHNRDIRPVLNRIEVNSESESQVEKENETRNAIVKKSKKKNKKKKNKLNKAEQADENPVTDTESETEDRAENQAGDTKKQNKTAKNETQPSESSSDSESESESKEDNTTRQKSKKGSSIYEALSVDPISESNPESQSDKEYEDAGAAKRKSYKKNKKKNNKNPSQSIISKHNNDDPAPGCSKDCEYEDNAQAAGTSASTNKMPKKKNKKNKKRDSMEMDEIDRCLMEVNKLLGEPELPSEPDLQEVDKEKILLAVEARHLDMNVELNRRFGPPEREPKGKKPPRNRPFKKLLIGIIHTHHYYFTKSGLSMIMVNSENGIKQFKFEHDNVYKKRIEEYFTQDIDMLFVYTVKNYQEKYTQVEILLDCASRHFLEQDYGAGCYNLEHVVAFMQCMAHPHFVLTDPNIRLDYKYFENRAFHIALLQYLYTVMNKSCHRTALEIAKVLLRIDPTDPLAVIPMCLDTLALNAEEYKWFIELMDYWDETKKVKKLFNIKFSYALAHFHVASKLKADTSHADELLQQAIMEYPYMTRVLLENINTFPKKKIPTHFVFNAYANKFTHVKFKELMLVHARLNSRNWKDRRVLAWLEQQLNKVLEKFNMEDYVSTQTLSPSVRCWPVSVNRHMSVLKEMSEFLTEGAIPPYLVRNIINPDPPMDGLDPYKFYPKPEEIDQMRLQRLVSNNHYMQTMGY